jgi:predicted aspartyl protease/Tfp pilus assembly protein PilF
LRQVSSVLWLLLVSLTAVSAWAGCAIKQMEIPVRIVDSRPIATLTLNGTVVPMLVDSGAFYSFLSASTATQLNLPLRSLPEGIRLEGYTGRIAAKRTRVEKVGLLHVEIPNVEFIVGGNELGAGIMGVLGRNILSMADTEYDLAHGVVRLIFPKGDCERTNFAYWAGEAPVISAELVDQGRLRADTAIRLEISVNGTRTLALLDTGAPQTSLTLGAAHRAGIEERDLTPNGRVGGAGNGRVKSWSGRFATVELGGEKITDNLLQVDDTDNIDEDMLVGLDYFLSHRIYVSRLQRKLYATWNGSQIFALGHPALGHFDTRYAALPQDIAKDDADGLARRGAAAMAAKNYQLALEDLNRACVLAPGVAEYFYARARLHLEMHQPLSALVDLDEALRINPALVEARFRRARSRELTGDRAGAQEDLAQLDATLPPSSNLRADMAQLYASFNQTSEALRQFNLWENTHQKDARLASVLNDRCWMRARLNIDLQLALQDCKDAIEIDDGASAYRDSLGWTYLRLGDASKAKKAFDGAITLAERPFSLYGRGLTLLRLNDSTGADRDLAAALKLNPKIAGDVRKQGFEFVDSQAQPALSGP